MYDLMFQHVSFFKASIPLPEDIQSKFTFLLAPILANAATGRKNEFIAGRYCAIKAAENLKHKVVTLPMGPHREPIWPDALVGSISHTKQTAVAVVAEKKRVKGVGIDLENIVVEKKVETIQKMVATDSDLKLIEALPAEAKKLAYTILFSAKESLYKCLYPICQCYIEFKEATLVSLDFVNYTFELELIAKSSSLQNLQGIYPGKFLVEDNVVLTYIEILN